MADQIDEDEVFDFSNVEFTRDDLVIALNDMVKEYRKISHSFEEAKAENMSLKSSSAESSSDELEDADILKTELKMSSWNKANLTLQKLYESQKQASDKTDIGFNNSEFCEGESSTQSRPAHDKFNKMSFVKADMRYNCLESVKYDNQNSPKLNENGKAGIGFSKPERFKPNWLKNRLDKDKAKASPKPFVPNQSWHNSKKVKSGWKKFQQRRDQYDHHMKPKLKRTARDFAHTFVDPRSGKTVRIVQIWVLKGPFVPYPSNPRALFSRELFRRFPVISGGCFARARLLPESSGFLAVLVVAQYKDVRASGNTSLSSPCWDRSHHAPSG
ncbi:hypothetical protein F511_33819 [Dorcoceras hygrometricum]|uniref:Uncharacterized protein n=1 Tax=Dorcoceras hygrometricum TaxID=472368 RepID=A0A2Z7BHT5_9LAMI|nr:hypothetical protein F511_33819 [Dorcoceras hygrometricum]